MFLQNLPTFSAASASILVTNMSSSPLMAIPMSLALETMLDNVPTGVTKSADDDLLNFVKNHREEFCLIGNKLLDEYFIDHIATKL